MTADSADSVLVLDTDGQAGLSIVRSLGRRGVRVTAGSPTGFPLGRLSRYSDAAYRYPDPDASAERFVDHLLDRLETGEDDVVIPVNDSTSAAVSKHKAALAATGTTVAVEDWETFRLAYDKERLLALAASQSVTVPETFAPESIAAAAEIAPAVPYPAVVKPRSKTVWDAAGRCHYTRVDDASYVESPEELVETFARLLEDNPVLERQEHYPLVQEYVDGTTTTTVVVAEEGEILTHFQEDRLRTYPSSGGSSTLLRERRDPEMLAAARAVIGALEWTGPAMVEFMRTPEGDLYLIEVNGRYWGSVPFAIDSGIDVPWHHYRLLRGDPVDAAEVDDRSRPIPLYQRLLFGDLKWLDERLRAGEPSALPRFLWTCLAARQVFVSREDPVPTLWALCQGVGVGGRSIVDRFRSEDEPLDADDVDESVGTTLGRIADVALTNETILGGR